MDKSADYDEAIRRLPDAQRAACEAIRFVKREIPAVSPVIDRRGVVVVNFEDGSGAFVDAEGRVTEGKPARARGLGAR
jgi:hypothetical protein